MIVNFLRWLGLPCNEAGGLLGLFIGRVDWDYPLEGE